MKYTVSTQKLSHVVRQHGRAAGVLMMIGVLVLAGATAPRLVSADSYEAKIRALQNKNNETREQVNELRVQAASYEEAITQLRGEIAAIERLIRENEQRQADIQAQIDEQQRELDRQRAVLGENIKAMYVNGEMSTIEMLATSKDLSEYVDKEAYRNAVQRKIQDTMAKIAKLQNELNAKKQEVEALIKEQEAQRATLDSNRAEQAKLLAMNQNQQQEFSNQLKANNAKIAELRRQQAIENARLFGGGGGGVIGGGGYPWGNAPCVWTGKVDGACPGYEWGYNGPGSWQNWNTGGYAYRNCTDWVAYRVRVAGGYVPSGLGNANTWDNRAPSYGYTVSSTPRQGAAAVSNAGTYGHVMYVEAVYGNGSILISDYNRAGTGKYDTNTLEYVGNGSYRNPKNGAISYLTFVYF